MSERSEQWECERHTMYAMLNVGIRHAHRINTISNGTGKWQLTKIRRKRSPRKRRHIHRQMHTRMCRKRATMSDKKKTSEKMYFNAQRAWLPSIYTIYRSDSVNAHLQRTNTTAAAIIAVQSRAEEGKKGFCFSFHFISVRSFAIFLFFFHTHIYLFRLVFFLFIRCTRVRHTHPLLSLLMVYLC